MTSAAQGTASIKRSPAAPESPSASRTLTRVRSEDLHCAGEVMVGARRVPRRFLCFRGRGRRRSQREAKAQGLEAI